jgi:hypothetical protein
MSEKFLHVGKGVDLPLSVVTSKAAILAMTGQGKTYLARVMAEEMLKHGARLVVADYTGAWWGLQSSASGKREGFPVVIFGGDHADVPITEDAGALIADVVVNERISAILDTSGLEDDAPKIRFMNAFARRLYHVNKRPVHIFLDEADEWVPQQPDKHQIQLLSIVKRIWQRGRLKGIGGTLISQRSAVVNKSLLSQSEMLIALRTVAPQDRAALGLWFESWGTKEQIAEFEKTISNLPDHHAWFWSPKHRLFVVSKARTAETFDSGKTPDMNEEIAEPERRTKIDVEKLGARIAKLAEDAKSDDPIVLKKQLAQYKQSFEDAKGRYVLLEQRLAKREKAKPVEVAKPVKVPYLSPKTLVGVRRSVKLLEKVGREMRESLTTIATAIARDVDDATKRLSNDLTKAADLFERARMMPTRAEMSRLPVPPVTPQPPKIINGGGNGNGSGILRGGMKTIATALAQYGSLKVSRARVLAGIASPDTMRTYVGKLKTLGFVVGSDPIELTPGGIEALGAWESLPTGDDLVSHWKRELGEGGLGNIFSVLISNRGTKFSPTALMSEAGINSPDTLRTYVGRLKTLGLVETERDGEIRIARDFEGQL